ncbi:hypothetical protein, partial [Salmonella enterica]|uniref:hypothetical protein n=2 Tax=Gammaproteobacteria TaxID=1236 RepID=UPI00329913A4
VLFRHLAARPREGTAGADFDDDAFVASALALGLRERRLANGILEHAEDESLRTLARMILAQHQAEDGIWAGFDTSTAGEDGATRLP